MHAFWHIHPCVCVWKWASEWVDRVKYSAGKEFNNKNNNIKAIRHFHWFIELFYFYYINESVWNNWTSQIEIDRWWGWAGDTGLNNAGNAINENRHKIVITVIIDSFVCAATASEVFLCNWKNEFMIVALHLTVFLLFFGCCYLSFTGRPYSVWTENVSMIVETKQVALLA